MRVREIMTKRVHTVAGHTPITAVAKLFAKRHISAVPVVDKRRRVIGVVSESDLLHRAETGTLSRRAWWLELFTEPASLAREFARTHAVHARDVMSTPVVSVAPGTDVAEVADLFDKHGINRVPVVADGRLVGIVSRADIVQEFAKRAAQPARRKKTSDASIRVALSRALKAKGWARDAYVNVVVDKGVVELSGAVANAEQRRALRILAEAVPGVRSVKDRTSVIPMASYV